MVLKVKEGNLILILIFKRKLARYTKFHLPVVWWEKCANSTGQDSLVDKPTFQYKIYLVLHSNVEHRSQTEDTDIDLLISMSVYITDGFN